MSTFPSLRETALLLFAALRVDNTDPVANRKIWDVASRMYDEEVPTDAPLAEEIWRARCRGVDIDRKKVAKACTCGSHRDLRLLHPRVAEALDRPLPPPATIAGVVPAPHAFPGQKGGVA
jgi:hypothetical protein